MSSKRLIVVSNRLPITVSQDPEGKWVFKESSGGLVSALSGLKKEMGFIWVGWPGVEIPQNERAGFEEQLLAAFSCVPVYIPDAVASMHYNGFSNSVLWPLFHYLPADIEFQEKHWEAYVHANRLFCEAVLNVAARDDLIWIHDYHLMLLPEFVRNAVSMPVSIGFFLHTPFPTSEVYRVLPTWKEVLRALVQSDLVGFHTYDYTRHFVSSCTRFLSTKSSIKGVLTEEGHVAEIGTFPIGIEPNQFVDALADPAIVERRAELRRKFGDLKIILGIDRLDYIKGVPQKLYAFDLFLATYPEYQQRVSIIQVAVPSRTDVEEYKNLKLLVEGLVGSINGKYGTADYTPIHYIYNSVSFKELVSLYSVADVCVVSSTRDGMNLVSYEYIASKTDKDGVLVLSEFAGAAQSLNGALLVNPWNIESLSSAYYKALEMHPDVRRKNMQSLQKYVFKFTATNWGVSFVERLKLVKKEPAEDSDAATLYAAMKSASNKLVFFDIDCSDHAIQKKLLFSIMQTCKKLGIGNVFVLSAKQNLPFQVGRDIAPVRLLFDSGATEFTSEALADHFVIGKEVGQKSLQLMQYYCERTPGSTIQESKMSLKWSFENVDRDFGTWQASQLVQSISPLINDASMKVNLRDTYVELHHSQASKENAILRACSSLGKGAVVVGNFASNMSYDRLKREASADLVEWCCHVGPEKTNTDLNVESFARLNGLLQSYWYRCTVYV